ncbi:NusG domain II-containing protein [Anaerovorax odorimutans]|uniref:NusG domain II-containing protein n=1 Tax=Anaerovorax odorimutans TaxID=109327 RepID=UPI0003FD3A1D|nr:NusG domain II-containing protein [Anaerovorax odorimutans]
MVKKADIYLGIVMLVLGVLFFLFILFFQETGSEVEITVDGELYGKYSLDKDAVIDIEKNGHINKLEIKDGKAKMIYGDCPDQYCVKHKSIDSTNDTIVCLPNKVVITVINGEERKIDAITN